MSGTVKKVLLSVGGFVGFIVVVILVRLAMMTLREFVPEELILVLAVGALVIGGASVWYWKYRRDQKWIKENQDLITGRRQRSSRPQGGDC